MCGIAGFFSPTNQFSEADLRAMTGVMQHRGPDAEGFFLNETKSCGLGHRRLSIIDLSAAANQPMFSHSGRYAIVFNGEIYNYQEVAQQQRITQKTSSDTEIILEAFENNGPLFIHLLNGMFAMAIYDKQDDSLYLFRDRLGVKPLYYFYDNNNFAFGSEIKSLLQAPFIRKNVPILKPALPTFLYAGYIPEPFTIYDNIKKLGAGTYALVKNGKLEIKNYWNPEEKIRETVESDFKKSKEELKQLLHSSVNYRMISDVPYGTFLSGGIDSSMVTAIAQRISNRPVKTFSIGFKEAKFNEAEHARKISKHLGTEHHEFMVTENDALELIDRMMTAYDEPYADSSAIPTMLVSKLARKYVTMTLSGDGGDELFMGYGAYQWANRLNNPLLKLLRRPITYSLENMGNREKRAAGVFSYKSKERIKSHIFSQEQYFFSENELEKLLKPEYAAGLLFNENFTKLNRKLSAAEEQALFDIKHYLRDDLLTKVDIASMQFSLEARTPFLDYRVVEFALNLSEKLKKKDGISKYLLKEVLYDYIPASFFERPKQGFAIPLGKWLKNELHYLLDKYLNEDALLQCGVVEPKGVSSLLNRFEAGEDYLYNRLWALLLMHKWIMEHAVNN